VTASTPGQTEPMSPLELAMLDFERRRWRAGGQKDKAIRDCFDISPTRYFQILNAVIDDPRALVADPVTVNRLRRLRESRRAARVCA